MKKWAPKHGFARGSSDTVGGSGASVGASVPGQTAASDKKTASTGLGGEIQADAGADTAAYIADLTAELTQMALRARQELLAYFLSLAHLEACSIARTAASPRPDVC